MPVIYDWSLTPEENQAADAGIPIYIGCPPANVGRSIRQLMARLRGFADDALYAKTVSIGKTAIALTLTEDYSKLTDGMAVRFAIPTMQQFPDKPNLIITNLQADDPLHELPLVYLSDVEGKPQLIQASAEAFAAGSCITAIYNKDFRIWRQADKDAEMKADEHLKGDSNLLKSDPQWGAKNDGCWVIFSDTNIAEIGKIADRHIKDALKACVDIPIAYKSKLTPPIMQIVATKGDCETGYKLTIMKDDPQIAKPLLTIITDQTVETTAQILKADASSPKAITGEITAVQTMSAPVFRGLRGSPFTIAAGFPTPFSLAHYQGYMQIDKAADPVWELASPKLELAEGDIDVGNPENTWFRVRYEAKDDEGDFFSEWSDLVRMNNGSEGGGDDKAWSDEQYKGSGSHGVDNTNGRIGFFDIHTAHKHCILCIEGESRSHICPYPGKHNRPSNIVVSGYEYMAVQQTRESGDVDGWSYKRRKVS